MDEVGQWNRRRDEQFDRLRERFRAFRGVAFPTEWAKVVNGVGLASLAMRAEKCLSQLTSSDTYAARRVELRDLWRAPATAAELNTLLDLHDRTLPALPPGPRAYFDELHAMVRDALAYTKEF